MGMDSPAAQEVRSRINDQLTGNNLPTGTHSSSSLPTTDSEVLTSDWGTIHDFILCDGVVLVVDIGSCASCLPLDDINLHVSDLNPHQQEVNLAYDHIF